MAIVHPQFLSVEETYSQERRADARESLLAGPPRLWSIVLAGGEGNRVRPLIERWLGHHLPKQYCTFTGTRSLFQHTLDRARNLTPDEHILVVIDRTHRQFMAAQLAGRSSIQVIAQPCNRDTAPGIFLPLCYVRQIDPHASVVIYPSDHFVFPEDQYIRVVRRAVAESAGLNRVILLGVAPDRPELEYGWIHPGALIDGNGHCVWSVRSFVEKPSLSEARAAMKAGALWNSFVLVGPVEQFWKLGWNYLPDMMPLFDTFSSAMQTGMESNAIDSIYERMPARNFSRDLLQRASEHIAVAKLENVFWSDWGSAGRIIHTLGRVNLRPAFPSMSPPLYEAFSS